MSIFNWVSYCILFHLLLLSVKKIIQLPVIPVFKHIIGLNFVLLFIFLFFSNIIVLLFFWLVTLQDDFLILVTNWSYSWIVFYSPITFRYLIFLTLPTLGFSQYFLSYAILRNFSSDIMRSISTLFMICIIFSNAIFLQSLSGIAIWFTLFRKFQIFQCLIHFPPSLAIVDFSIKIFFFTILHFNLPMLQLFQLNLFYIHDLYIWYQCALSFLTTL